MTVYQWLSLLGVPALLGGIAGYALRLMRQSRALKKGLQALLRDRLYAQYTLCCEKGWASMDERRNFINMYTQYHLLGANGVMDDVRDRFYRLPMRKGGKEDA